MSDTVYTNGRRMSRALQEAIDEPTGTRRAAIRQTLLEYADTAPTMGRIYKALALELGLAGLREADTLQHLNAQFYDEPGSPTPPPSGRTLYLDTDGRVPGPV